MVGEHFFLTYGKHYHFQPYELPFVLDTHHLAASNDVLGGSSQDLFQWIIGPWLIGPLSGSPNHWNKSWDEPPCNLP